jgi:malonyl-CoA O-methyltransferase
MATKHIVERNFSRHAGRYDAHTSVQKTIGAHLIERLGSHACERILDVGCGTGDYTGLLHERYPTAHISGIDISAAMVNEARHKLGAHGIEFIVADAETTEFDGPFDLITSNACFHWFADLDGTIGKCAGALAPDGLLAFTSLGPRTFWELGECLDAVLAAHKPISARSFVDTSDLEAMLRRHFPCVSVVEETLVEAYPSLLQLLNTIKYAGTRGSGLEGITLTKILLEDLERTYHERVGSIAATYQVIYCRAGKKEAQRL